MNLTRTIIAGIAALSLLAMPVQAADKIRIGVITTHSGPGATLGKHLQDGIDLALKELGGKLGGVETEVFYGDDQQKPDVGRQLAEEMIKKNRVDIILGVIWSNVLLSAYQPIIKSGAIFIGVGGPHEVAGAMCAPNFFSTSWQNDEPAEAMGHYLSERKIDGIYTLVPNYAAGKDMAQGFKRFYKGRIIGEVYTKLDQTDYQTELTQLRAANPKAAFIFYPGGLGIQFLKQFDQAGLRQKIPLYSIFTANEVILPALGDAAAGNFEAGFYSPDLKNPANEAFVRAFRQAYNYMPSDYAASGYDGIRLLDSGIRAVKGDIADKKPLIVALEKADFKSVRGNFSFNRNHFPIQDFHLFQVVKAADGTYVRKEESTIFTAHKDSYYEECKMK
jgi:branched-chain amino acid transport system substrate-binding protein